MLASVASSGSDETVDTGELFLGATVIGLVVGCASGGIAGYFVEEAVQKSSDEASGTTAAQRRMQGSETRLRSATAVCADASACYAQGHAQYAVKDYLSAALLFRQACQLGSVAACTNLGWMYHYGRGVTLDHGAAMRLYKHACDAGNQQGCENLRKLQSPPEPPGGAVEDQPKAIGAAVGDSPAPPGDGAALGAPEGASETPTGSGIEELPTPYDDP